MSNERKKCIIAFAVIESLWASQNEIRKKKKVFYYLHVYLEK